MSAQLPNLHSLLTMARKEGVDIRPTLIRVLTDLYVEGPTPTDAEKHRYCELAGRLLDSVPEHVRALIAEKLADCTHAPHAVLLRLANDTIEVARPVLMRSRQLTNSDLLALANTADSARAAAIAERQTLSDDIAEQLMRVTDKTVDDALARVFQDTSDHYETLQYLPAHETGSVIPELRPSHSEFTETKQPPQVQTAPVTANTSKPAHDYAEIENILNATSRIRQSESPALSSLADTVPVWRKLETAALSRNIYDFSKILEQTLGLSSRLCHQIINDTSGEPLIVVLKTLDISADVVSRILLFLNPQIGRSVERVFTLSTMYSSLDATDAKLLVADWTSTHDLPAQKTGISYARSLFSQTQDASRASGSGGYAAETQGASRTGTY